VHAVLGYGRAPVLGLSQLLSLSSTCLMRARSFFSCGRLGSLLPGAQGFGELRLGAVHLKVWHFCSFDTGRAGSRYAQSGGE